MVKWSGRSSWPNISPTLLLFSSSQPTNAKRALLSSPLSRPSPSPVFLLATYKEARPRRRRRKSGQGADGVGPRQEGRRLPRSCLVSGLVRSRGERVAAWPVQTTTRCRQPSSRPVTRLRAVAAWAGDRASSTVGSKPQAGHLTPILAR